MDKACQTDCTDVSYFRSIKSEYVTNSAELSELIGSSTTSNEQTDKSEEYQSGSAESEEESDSSEGEFPDDESDEIDEVQLVKEDQTLMCDLTISIMENNLRTNFF